MILVLSSSSIFLLVRDDWNRKQPDLALKCIDQLMNTNTFNFSRYGVDVSNALMHCLSLAQTPIHPVRSMAYVLTAHSVFPV